jgi:hypothetical protein
MVAVVVRLAHMLDLYHDREGSQHTPFEAEMRRRLWWQIVLLDMRAAEDVSSDFHFITFQDYIKIPKTLHAYLVFHSLARGLLTSP